MAKKTFKLAQTKGNFKFDGVVVGISKDTAFVESETKDHKPYRSVRFMLKTSPTNIENVELFGAEQDFVYAYSRNDQKTLKVPFKDRNNEFAEGYHLIGVNVTVGEERSTFADFDAAEAIYQGFSDGDSVHVAGEIKPNSYISSTTGLLVSNFKYIIKTIYTKKKPVDFEDASFTETASFDHELIITDTNLDKDTDKVIVNGYVIGYADSVKQVQFVIHNDKNAKLGKNFLKLKFGDYIKVLGICTNAPMIQAVEEDEWGSEVPQGYNTGGKYISELRITAVDKDKDGTSLFTKKKYTEEDFAEDEQQEEEPDFNPKKDEEDLDDDLPF